MKAYIFYDAITRRRTDGALVRFITPISENKGFEFAEKTLVQFVKELEPVLVEYIPN